MNKTITTKQAMRYSRQILLAGFDLDKQERLISSSALMLGAGGLGSAAAQYLVAAGIGTLTLIDDDTVEITNLQRQILHFEDSVGLKKVVSAAKTLAQINSESVINVVDKRLGEKALIALADSHDIVLDCTDNLATRNLINQVCYQTKTPLVSGAAIRMEGQLFCVLPQQQSACYACISQFFGEQNLSCVEAGVMSPLVGIVGAHQALEAIKIVTQYGTPSVNKLQLFDAMHTSWEAIYVPPAPECPVCAKHR
jgi:adenylyltransferase/sulfurtransferase